LAFHSSVTAARSRPAVMHLTSFVHYDVNAADRFAIRVGSYGEPIRNGVRIP
jgi:hypothetical protein